MIEYNKEILEILLYGNEELDALYGDGSQKCMEALKKRECELVGEISDPVTLHLLVSHYNFDDGFEIPKAIIENKNCCMSTALYLFYLSEGLDLLLSNREEFLSEEPDYSKNRAGFLLKLEQMILDGAFSDFKIQYTPPFSRTDRYCIKKYNLDIPEVFLAEIQGVCLDKIYI